MKTVKYYYSEPFAVSNLPVVLGNNGEMIDYFDVKKLPIVKRLPKVTVASVYDPDTNSMSFGMAVCSPKDMFVKKTGREIAYKRAIESPKLKVVGIRRKKIRETSTKHAEALIKTYLSSYVPIAL